MVVRSIASGSERQQECSGRAAKRSRTARTLAITGSGWVVSMSCLHQLVGRADHRRLLTRSLHARSIRTRIAASTMCRKFQVTRYSTPLVTAMAMCAASAAASRGTAPESSMLQAAREIRRTLPSMSLPGEGASRWDRALVGCADPSPLSAVSAHAGDGPSRFRPPGGEVALTAHD